MTAPLRAEVTQNRLVLTSHPLQRVGAFALAALSGERGEGPEALSAAGFEEAMRQVRRDASLASIRESKAPDGFWQKASLSFFPNSPMNHPGRRKGKNSSGRAKTDADVRAGVLSWLTCPGASQWPGVACALCGRDAVGFFGKRDVPLAESEAYRNTTPPGHGGVALCWPCLCCFYALPYGCHLTGGSSVAVHSQDDLFVGRTVRRQAHHNTRVAALKEERQAWVREVVALRALRGYSERLIDGVELLVFNNNNRGQSLESFCLTQPLAEWLRHTIRPGPRKRGFVLLTRAHVTPHTPGVVGLARNAFHAPPRLVTAGVRGLEACVFGPYADRGDAHALAELLFSFATEVEQVDQKDVSVLRVAAGNIAQVLFLETGYGRLKEFRAKMRNSRQFRNLLLKETLAWTGRAPNGPGQPALDGPLVSERAFRLLFDPSEGNSAWFHRDLLLICVLDELSRLGWRAKDQEKPEDVLAALDKLDHKVIEEEEEDDS